MIIAFEGPDGAGKSTLIKSLYSLFHQDKATGFSRFPWAKDLYPVMTREPYDSHLGTYLRVVLTERELDPKTTELAFLAARSEMYDDLRADVASDFSLILSDRSCVSGIVYQRVIAQGQSPEEAVEAYCKAHQWYGIPFPHVIIRLLSQAPMGQMLPGMDLMQKGKDRMAYNQAYDEVCQELRNQGHIQQYHTISMDHERRPDERAMEIIRRQYL